jgi:hypothetical protein
VVLVTLPASALPGAARRGVSHVNIVGHTAAFAARLPKAGRGQSRAVRVNVIISIFYKETVISNRAVPIRRATTLAAVLCPPKLTEALGC